MKPSPVPISQARALHRTVREQIADLATVTPEEATAQGAHSITVPYCIRQIDQCRMLLRVIEDFRGVDILIVQMPEGLEVWRKA